MAQTGPITSSTAPFRTTDNMNAGSSTSSASSTSSSSGIQSASDIQKQFMTLLITQLQNQDPENPTDSSQMTTQLTQLSQLEQVEQLSTSVQQMTFSQQMSQGASLLGKQVAYQPSGADQPLSGTVSEVYVQSGNVMLQVGQDSVNLTDVQAVQNAQ